MKLKDSLGYFVNANFQIFLTAEHITLNFATAKSGVSNPRPQSGAMTSLFLSI